jgi:hypothetical protein
MKLQARALAQALGSTSTDATVRDATLQVVVLLSRLEFGQSVVVALATVARDTLALVPLWRIGLLDSTAAMEVLLARMTIKRVDQDLSKINFCATVM